MILVRQNILKSDLICLAEGRDHKCDVFFLELASVFFLLARFGRKTDGHIINIRMCFYVF